MDVETFWRTSPRIINLVIEGYRRRRAWAAHHAGYGIHCKDADIAHLLGRTPRAEPEEMTADQLVQNIRRWRIAKAAKSAQPKEPPHVE